MHLIIYSGADRRCENLPTNEEVAIVIPDEYRQSCFCDIVLHLHQALQQGSVFSWISPNHAAYMPLHYVLLFLYGDPGWHWALQLQDPNNVRIRLWLCQ